MRSPRVAVLLGGLAFFTVAASAEVRTADFPIVVSEILMSQTEGPMSSMSETKKLLMIECVNEVLNGLPKGKKRYVLEGVDLAEQERRFGKVVMENKAEWVQKIAGACARIATQEGI